MHTLYWPSSVAEFLSFYATVIQRGELPQKLRFKVENPGSFSTAMDEPTEPVEKLVLHERFMKPFQRLPNELCLEIFLACLPDKNLPTLNGGEAPLLLTRVSKAWRYLALNTPKLWSSVHIPLPVGSHQTDKLVSRICRRFEDAQNAPMHVSLWSSAHSGILTQHPVTACVISHSFHIRTLELNVSTEVLAHFYTIGGGHVDDGAVEEGEASCVPKETLWPVLEKVVLDFGMEDWDSPMMRGYDVPKASFWLAPHLKSVTLISVSVDTFDLPLRWGQLEEIIVEACGPHDYPDQLDDQSFTPGEAKHLLNICPKLSTLSIVISGRDYELTSIHPPSSHQLIHHHLTDLYLEDIIVNPDIHSTTFLKDLQLPTLKTLTYFLKRPQRIDMMPVVPYPPTSDNPLLCFLQAQDYPVPITTFKTEVGTISYRGMVECLALMPKLEALRMYGDWYRPFLTELYDDQFLSMFLPSNSRRVFKEEMRAGEGEEHGHQPENDLNSDSPLRLPATGLCPRLDDFIINGAGFTADGILRFIYSRLALSSGHDALYSRPQRFYAILMTEMKSDSIARSGSAGTNSTEEALQGLGLDVKIVREKNLQTARTVNTDKEPGWDEPREAKISAYDPKRGLPESYKGDAEVWYRYI